MPSIAAKIKRELALSLSKGPNHIKLSRMLLAFGGIILGVGLVLFLLVFYPVISAELHYQFFRPDPKVVVAAKPQSGKKTLTPVDSQFGIVIPKIEANAKVIPNVNPYDPKDYQWQLTKGVAHARGTVFPGQVGNVFIFAHSAGDFMEANRFNAVFYLLYKLNKGDDIDLFYKGEKFKYQVTQIKYVEATDVKYLSGNGNEKTVTLMTCWPPGTTLRRLIVVGKISG